MTTKRKYKPYYSNHHKRWIVKFASGDLPNNQKTKLFKTEEGARTFVLDIFPDIYDEKIEIEKKCKKCNLILPAENFVKNYGYDSLSNCCRSCKYKSGKAIHDNRRDNNQCKYCPEPKLSNSLWCYVHWFKDAALRHLKDSNLGINLINLYEKQNRRCIYTNVELSPTTNMSLDHIKPSCRYPELTHDINNVQWVHRDVNTMKNKFCHDQFIALCKYIASRF